MQRVQVRGRRFVKAMFRLDPNMVVGGGGGGGGGGGAGGSDGSSGIGGVCADTARPNVTYDAVVSAEVVAVRGTHLPGRS